MLHEAIEKTAVSVVAQQLTHEGGTVAHGLHEVDGGQCVAALEDGQVVAAVEQHGQGPLAVGHVVGLPAGFYRYRCLEHALEFRSARDLRPELYRAALSQRPVERAPVTLLFTAVYGRTTATYGSRGVRYVDMEAGHAAQNLSLQAAALDLKSVVIGAFHDDEVKQSAALPADETPLYLVPVGR